MTHQLACELRDSTATDIAGIAEIYGYWVEHGLASFELTPPSVTNVGERRTSILSDGFPYLVAAESDGRVLGYAYASWYRERPGYRFTCENSVYVAPGAMRRGVGTKLLARLVTRCTALEMRIMVAVIGDSGNHASIALHRRVGFEQTGVLPSIGWKHGRWLDAVLMVRRLGEGNTTPPKEHGRLLTTAYSVEAKVLGAARVSHDG